MVVLGDMVEVYVNRERERRGKWSSPLVFIKVDRSSWTVNVPPTRGNTMEAAVEDVRPAVDDGSFASHVHDSNDGLDDDLSQEIAPAIGADSP